MKDMIKKQVEKFCKKHGKSLYNQHLQKKKELQAQVVHQVPCSQCGLKEIVGIRYKCTQRPDHNICQKCEDVHGQNSEYSFIKIRKPEHAPVHLICQYGNKQPQIPEGYEIELRHAPVPKSEKKDLLQKFEGEDLDKSESMFRSNYPNLPQVHAPTTNDMKVSELTKSTMGSIQFVEKCDLVKDSRIKQNLL